MKRKKGKKRQDIGGDKEGRKGKSRAETPRRAGRVTLLRAGAPAAFPATGLRSAPSLLSPFPLLSSPLPLSLLSLPSPSPALLRRLRPLAAAPRRSHRAAPPAPASGSGSGSCCAGFARGLRGVCAGSLLQPRGPAGGGWCSPPGPPSCPSPPPRG